MKTHNELNQVPSRPSTQLRVSDSPQTMHQNRQDDVPDNPTSSLDPFSPKVEPAKVPAVAPSHTLDKQPTNTLDR